MKEIQLVHFQNNISHIIDAVVLSQQTVVVSDNGKLLVKIVPLSETGGKSWLGCMKHTGKITGDIVSPAEDENVWEVLTE